MRRPRKVLKQQQPPVSLRMPREIKQQLEGYATTGERTLSGLILFILRQWLEFQQGLKK